MSYTPDNSIDRANMVLDLLSKKQQAISANLANVNTPGYVRQDVDFGQFLGSSNGPLETKLSQKLGPSAVMNEGGGEVSTAAELIALQKNMIFYTLATRQVTSVIQELKTIAQLGK